MPVRRSRSLSKAFTLIEVLVVVLIIGILTLIVLPDYLSSVFVSRQISANSNAKTLATAVQAKAVVSQTYDTTLADYATDMGGHLPQNPCTGTTTGFTITVTSSTTASVVASSGTNCGSWIPTTYNLTL